MAEDTFSKEQLIEILRSIREMGWVKNNRFGNVGGVGNTLEDLLGIKENNLPIPNASEWELKCQRSNTTSLTTLMHSEPSPTAVKFVPSILLPLYGWKHKLAGTKYPDSEMSFRQTISGVNYSDRGFKVLVDRKERKILISFNSNFVSGIHTDWLNSVTQRVGLNELDPQPYWGFDDVFHKAGIKLLNTFYVIADVKKVDKIEYYHYSKIYKLQQFSIENLLSSIEAGFLYIDFDARTGHNHGTKFRLRQGKLPALYQSIEEL